MQALLFISRPVSSFQPISSARGVSLHVVKTSSLSSPRPALVYLPDGELVDDSLLDSEEDLTTVQPSSLVEYLNNNPDAFRGPLAILAAAHSSVDIESIVGLTAVSANEEQLVLDILSAADDQNCVKVKVEVKFPDGVPSSTDSERLEALNTMYPGSQATVDAKQKKKQGFSEEEAAATEDDDDEAKDINVPYDAAARLAYELSDKSMEYDDFKTQYETLAVADVIAKRAATTVDDVEPHKIDSKVEKEETGTSVSKEETSTSSDREKAIREARRQPKSPEEEARLAAKYAAIEDLSERAFTILVDLYMVEATPWRSVSILHQL